MTKEELEKEAKEYAEAHKMDMIDYHDSLFMEDAYIASAESREKRIAELEKENADLKAKLIKAKGIIKRLLVFIPKKDEYFQQASDNIRLIAEKFLKEE